MASPRFRRRRARSVAALAVALCAAAAGVAAQTTAGASGPAGHNGPGLRSAGLAAPTLLAPVPAEGEAGDARRTANDQACIDAAAFGRARRFARTQPGHVSFAVFVGGSLRTFDGSRVYRSASIVKAMLLVADLRRQARSGRPLGGADRVRLASMIRRSDNAAATATFNRVGRSAVLQVARLAGMRSYRVGGGWGTSQVTAADQARLFGRLGSLLPARYRAFARGLLRSIVPEQTWGGARVARRHGWRTLFKSGWLPRQDGWVVHQGLRLERGRCTVAIVVLTGRQRSMSRGIASIRGVVERLI